MTNPIIQTDIADILQELKSDQKEILQEVGNLKQDVNEVKLGQAKLEGKVESLDEKLSGKIESLDEKLSGQIKALDTKTEQLNERIKNSELTNRGILIGLVVIILGGAAKLFGFMGNSWLSVIGKNISQLSKSY